MKSGSELSTSVTPLVSAHDLVMLDLDGVVYVGPDPVDHAVATITSLGVPVSYLTNNATRSAREVAEHLRSFGLDLQDAAVVTAGQVVAEMVHAAVGDGARVLLAGADGMRQALEERGLVVVASADDAPRAVVQGGVIDVRWSELAEASYAVAAGVPWFASNPDQTFPTPRGLAPGNGAFVQAVALATGGRPVVAGKPGTPVYDEARRRTGASRPVMVGDRPDTDIDGAIAADVESLLVLTGVCTLADLAALPSGRRPSYVAADLRGLLEPHPTVVLDADRATCADAVARVDGDRVLLEQGQADTLAGLRAVVALAWATRDRGRIVSVEDVRMGA